MELCPDAGTRMAGALFRSSLATRLDIRTFCPTGCASNPVPLSAHRCQALEPKHAALLVVCLCGRTELVADDATCITTLLGGVPFPCHQKAGLLHSAPTEWLRYQNSYDQECYDEA